jgi:hypothetical protein
VPGAADAGAAIEHRPTRGEENREGDEAEQRREDQQGRGRDQDVEAAEDDVDRARFTLRGVRDQLFQGLFAESGVA